jgi:uncharacterized membrane protein
MKDFIKAYKHTIICICILLFLSLIGYLMVLLREIITHQQAFGFLIWNLFLAWIPVILSVLISMIFSLKKRLLKYSLLVPIACLWLLFYPNAPYMITDFIHFRNNHSFLIWYDLVIYTLFIWTAFLLGFVSMYIVMKQIEQRADKITSWLFVLSTLFLSSYGVYLGRFVRHNSWDLLFNPFIIMKSVFININCQSLIFSLSFGTLLAILYAFLYSLTYLKLEKS